MLTILFAALYYLLLGGLVLMPLYILIWVIQLGTRNASIVDIIWAISFPLCGLTYFFAEKQHSSAHILLLVMVVIWGVRLAIYLIIRSVGHGEDVRYTALRNEWGKKQNLYMLRFYVFQAVLAVLLSLPLALAMANADESLSWPEWVGFAIWLVGVGGESLADSQLRHFKNNPANKGKVCQSGLWNYSRHPNYFFEWLIWVSLFVFGLGSPWGVLGLVSPVAMLYFLLRVTGIPYTETQMIKSRGQAFIDYQKTTSSFIPLPKRHVV